MATNTPSKWQRWGKIARRELVRVTILLLLGALFVFASTPLAQWSGEPAFAAWGLFLGGAFVAVALSHICRRLLFPQLDLQAIARDAMRDRNIAAALIFLGICWVLAAFVMLTGSMLRM